MTTRWLFALPGLFLTLSCLAATSTNSSTNTILPSMEQVNTWTSGLLTTAKEATQSAISKTTEALLKSGLLGSPEQDRVNRRLIPNSNQSQFGKGVAGNCVPNSFAHYVIWWDSEGFLAIPKTFKKEDQKYEWVHEELEKAFKTRPSGTKGSELTEGMQAFFGKHYKDRAEITTFSLAPTAKNLSDAASGYNAAVLCLSIYNQGKPEDNHAVTLVEADEQGNISFITWGYRWEGRVIPYRPKSPSALAKALAQGLLQIDVVDDPANSYRAKLESHQLEFVIDPENDPVLVAVPKPLKTEKK